MIFKALKQVVSIPQQQKSVGKRHVTLADDCISSKKSTVVSTASRICYSTIKQNVQQSSVERGSIKCFKDSTYRVESVTSTCTDESSVSSEVDEAIRIRDSTIGSTSSSCRRNLRVHFNPSLEEVVLVESYREYAEELWEKTKIDSKEVSQRFRTLKENDSAGVDSYLTGYATAMEHVYPKSYSDRSIEFTTKCKPKMLSSRLFKELVNGRVSEFAGLEKQCPTLSRLRTYHLKKTRLAILSVYHSYNTSSDLTCNEISKRIASFSRSLSRADRYWAAAVGQADADALVVDDKLSYIVALAV